MFQHYNDCYLNVMKTMGDKSVNLILTSPPYNMRTRINNNKYTKREIQNIFLKSINILPMIYLLKNIIIFISRASKKC